MGQVVAIERGEALRRVRRHREQEARWNELTEEYRSMRNYMEDLDAQDRELIRQMWKDIDLVITRILCGILFFLSFCLFCSLLK